MNNAISAVDFFRDTLKQDVITLSMHSAQSEQIGLEALDGFVVQAAAKGLLVEVWIEGEKRNYEFGDYVKLLKRESRRFEENPYLDDDYAALHKSDDERSFHEAARKALDDLPPTAKKAWNSRVALQNVDEEWDDDGTPKG